MTKQSENYLQNHTQLYLDKTYASWLGKISGVIAGSQIEGWDRNKINQIYGDIKGYPQTFAKNYAADDDINGPLYFMKAIELWHPTKSDEQQEPSVTDMANVWKNYICNHKGFFWWGGYGVSTEHTAYDNLSAGINAPQSGSQQQNGVIISQQIGSQIFADCWGWIAPANKQQARRLAIKMASVSHDGIALDGAGFIASMVSLAYTNHPQTLNNQTSNSVPLIDLYQEALEQIPSTSLYRTVLEDVLAFYQQDTSKDWHTCYDFIASKYNYEHYTGVCHIIPNAALVAMSLLYCAEDFSQAINIANSAGWDTDCNAGNVATILGAYLGTQGIDKAWLAEFNDFVASSGAIGSWNSHSVPELVAFTHRMATLLDTKTQTQQKALQALESPDLNATFTLNKSTQALRTSSDCPHLETEYLYNNNDYLTIKLKSGNTDYGYSHSLYYQSYYQAADFDDSRYDPTFCPRIYPSATFSFTLRINANEQLDTLCATPYYQLETGEKILGQRQHINKQWQSLTLTTQPDSEPTRGHAIKTIGVLLSPELFIGDTQARVIIVDIQQFTADNHAHYTLGSQQFTYDNWSPLRQEINQFVKASGLWIIETYQQRKHIIGQALQTDSLILTGHHNWQNYTLKTTITPISGAKHYIGFRVQGMQQGYYIGFENDKIVLKINNFGWSTLAEQAFTHKHNQAYTFTIAARQNTLQIALDDTPILHAQDSTLTHGQIAYLLQQHSRCAISTLTLTTHHD